MSRTKTGLKEGSDRVHFHAGCHVTPPCFYSSSKRGKLNTGSREEILCVSAKEEEKKESESVP